MTDGGLTGARADWIALWREAMAAQELTHRALDDRAGFSEGYVSKLMCGQVREPTSATIDRINRALDIRFHVERTLTP
jgi:predicted transcriptional regulator